MAVIQQFSPALPAINVGHGVHTQTKKQRLLSANLLPHLSQGINTVAGLSSLKL